MIIIIVIIIIITTTVLLLLLFVDVVTFVTITALWEIVTAVVLKLPE